ncbi:MAG: SDR family oxidoreductase [Gammaproteobacteria bacterium]|nr:SDR family oxidoreductase [Gammaproteobacteria bacterium]
MINPVAIVTGAATGIGAAIAEAFAQRHWRVVINFRRSEEAARATAERCETAGGEVWLCQADISQDADCRRLAREAEQHWGRIDALINNAGTTRFVAADDLEGLDAAAFQQIFATNVIGAFQMGRAVAPAMRALGRGSIVNISSFAGQAGFGSSIAYAASKGALNTLTVSLARTLAPEIRVNAVSPSFVDTYWLKDNMNAQQYLDLKQRVEHIAPLGAIATPQDVADAVVWLTEAGRLVTGEILGVDAGMHLAHPLAVKKGTSDES